MRERCESSTERKFFGQGKSDPETRQTSPNERRALGQPKPSVTNKVTTMSRKEQFVAVIQQLRENVPDITGIMIASVDGLAIATDFPEEEAARVAAMGASALGLGNRITKTTELGDMVDLMIEGKNELLIIYMAGPGAMLAIRSPRRANLGLIRLEGPKSAKQVAELVVA
jgi:predicted regulator of Ras-like GTPase activity (Roadblock/LC7/MglB family)